MWIDTIEASSKQAELILRGTPNADHLGDRYKLSNHSDRVHFEKECKRRLKRRKL